MPHVTWCVAGPLAFLPIHAAGIYGVAGQPKVFDFVVSSYTPTLASLLNAKERPFSPLSQPMNVLAVSQPATPNQTALPGTVAEIQAIQLLHASNAGPRWLNDEQATVNAV
jgi:hypothetical protein